MSEDFMESLAEMVAAKFKSKFDEIKTADQQVFRHNDKFAGASSSVASASSTRDNPTTTVEGTKASTTTTASTKSATAIA